MSQPSRRGPKNAPPTDTGTQGQGLPLRQLGTKERGSCVRLAYLSPDVARGLGGAGGWADKIRGVCARGGVTPWTGVGWGGVVLVDGIGGGRESEGMGMDSVRFFLSEERYWVQGIGRIVVRTVGDSLCGREEVQRGRWRCAPRVRACQRGDLMPLIDEGRCLSRRWEKDLGPCKLGREGGRVRSGMTRVCGAREVRGRKGRHRGSKVGAASGGKVL